MYLPVCSFRFLVSPQAGHGPKLQSRENSLLVVCARRSRMRMKGVWLSLLKRLEKDSRERGRERRVRRLLLNIHLIESASDLDRYTSNVGP